MHKRHQLIISGACLFLLFGCGSDHDTGIQKEDLRAKVVQLETQLDEQNKSHQAELDALKKVVAQHTRQLSYLTTGTTRSSEITSAPNRDPRTGYRTSTQQQQQLRSRDNMMREASKRPDYQSANRSKASAAVIIRQLYGTRPTEEIARTLNQKNIKNKSGNPWTAAEVQKYALENRLEKAGTN